MYCVFQYVKNKWEWCSVVMDTQTADEQGEYLVKKYPGIRTVLATIESSTNPVYEDKNLIKEY